MWPYIFAAVLGALLGLSDLMSRYRDAPFSALQNFYTYIFAIINSGASIATLLIIKEMNLVSWPNAGSESIILLQVIIAGVGAMAILRVGFSIQISGETLNISLATLLQPILQAADNEVDRARASNKLRVTKDLMLGLNAEAALRELPTFCLFLMQSVSAEDQKRLADDIKALAEQNLQDDVKLISLGSALMNTVGENVLRSAVAAFRESQNRRLQPAAAE